MTDNGAIKNNDVTRGGGKDASTYNVKDGLYNDSNKQNGGDPFKNALENTQPWELAYMQQDYMDGNNPDYIDDEEEFRKKYIAGDKTVKSTKKPSGSPNQINQNNTATSDDGFAMGMDDMTQAEFTRWADAAINNDNDWWRFYPQVQGRHNALHDYNSYNYNITLVALSEEQLNDPNTYKGRIINSTGNENKNFYIVAKSGGFTRQNAGTSDAAANFKSKPTSDPRNTDLFIENLEFETRPGINDMGNSNLTTGTFEVTEPHSVSQFYRELFNASKFAGHADYIDAPFLLIISFIGRKVDEDEATIPEKTTRYLPIKIQNSEMQVDESGARYSVKFLGYNSSATKTVVNTLWEDTTPLVQQKESVESIVASVFLKQTRNEAERYAKHLEDLEGDAEKLKEAKALVSKAKQSLKSETNVGYYIPNKYYVWFADGYLGGSFPTNASQFSNLSGQWDSAVAGWTDNTDYQGFPKLPSPGNEMGRAGLNKKIRPGGPLKVDSYEAELTKRKEEYQAKKKLLDAAKSTLNAELAAFDSQRTALSNLLKKSGIREDDTETKKLQSPTLGVNSRTEEAKKDVDKKKEEALAIADKLLGVTDGRASTPNVPPAQSKLTAAELAEVKTLRDNIVATTGKINSDADALAKLDQETKDLQEAYEKFVQGDDTVYDLTSTGTPWSFRKGSTLMTVVESMITNSQYMDIFKDKSKIDKIVDTEMIPWFKTEIISKIIGFDVATMRFVHEYHYVITPFNVHYSSMPGINIVFTTNQLRNMAIREYNYLYTGKNIDVLSYNIRYNNLFTTPLLLNPPDFNGDKSDDVKEATTNTIMNKETMEQVVQDAIQNRLGNSGSTPATPVGRLAGKEGPNNRDAIGKIFQDFLYNPPFERHLILSDLDIVGDPVYIQGSGITDRPRVSSADIVTPDGEMNSFTHEPHVILNIRYPDDIPTSAELEEGKFEQKLMTDQYTGVFQIFNVRNSFSEGVFKQTLRLARKKNQPEDYTDNNAYMGST